MTEGVVREVYKRFSEGDIDGFLKLCADDIEWVVNGCYVGKVQFIPWH
jgi:ketosteroid isomerase-like protein